MTVEVECSGTRHRITWRRGEIVAHDHDVEAETVAERLGGVLPYCLRVLGAWGTEDIDLVSLLGGPQDRNPRQRGMAGAANDLVKAAPSLANAAVQRAARHLALWDLPAALRHRLVLDAAEQGGADEETVSALQALAAGTLPLDRPTFRLLAQRLDALGKVRGGLDDEEDKVLARFFDGRRLSEIPSQLSKRRVVLQRLSREFEPGTDYTERQVNQILAAFHLDFAALRRYLVDEGLLTRQAGIYRRVQGA